MSKLDHEIKFNTLFYSALVHISCTYYCSKYMLLINVTEFIVAHLKIMCNHNFCIGYLVFF